MFSREQIHILEKRIKQLRRFIQIITGPRQSGKTTLVEQCLKRHKGPYYYVSADGVLSSSSIWISEQWEAARIKLLTSGAKSCLLGDR